MALCGHGLVTPELERLPKGRSLSLSGVLPFSWLLGSRVSFASGGRDDASPPQAGGPSAACGWGGLLLGADGWSMVQVLETGAEGGMLDTVW